MASLNIQSRDGKGSPPLHLDQLIAKFTYSYASLDTLQLAPDLYFESPTGFGMWRLLFSSSCLRDREQSHSVLKTLKYVVVVGGESGN